MKRFRWSAALAGLLLVLSWAGTAPAASPTGQATNGQTVTEPSTAPTQPPPGDELCDPDDGITSHSEISTDTASAHPSASASFTVKEGCRVIVFLVSVDEDGELVDSDPALDSEDPISGPGEHTLKVDLPDCQQFFVFFDAFKLPKEGEPPAPEDLLKAQRATAEAVSNGDEPPELEVVPLDRTEGDTTNCPTSSSSPSTTQAPTTTAAPGQLPFTGSNSLPLLIAALVMLTVGGAALLAARTRDGQAG